MNSILAGSTMPLDLAKKLAGFDANLPLSRAHTIPSTWYFDEDIYEAERQHVFGKTWQVAVRLDQVPRPGTFCTVDIAGEPIVIVRDESGTLRAFHNVCRHRAAKVMNDEQGQCSRLRCRYHGWTYDLQGRLRGVPEFDGVEDFPREANGLPPLHVATWGPYVFVHDGNRTPPPLEEYLAPLPEIAAQLGIEKLQFVERREYVVECNWKVYIDNYQDGGYHINTVHPGLASAVNYSEYRNQLGEYASVQISPLQPSSDDQISRLRSGDAAYYWWGFPNFIVNLYSGVMDTNIVVPLGPNRCKVIFDFFFPAAKDEEGKKFIRESIAVSDVIQKEDVGICEEVQQGLKSRTYSTGRYSVKREEPVYFFHRLLARFLREGVT